MTYIANTPEDVKDMLAAIGVESIDDLFAAIPAELRCTGDYPFPDKLSHPELVAHMTALAARNRPLGARPSFLGGGAYRHYVPALVDALATRGEFVTAYTPYQPEASQGTLQAAFEFQSLVCELTGLDVANASLYDGATALVEALFMLQARRDGRPGRFLVTRGVHPDYRRTLETYCTNLPLTIEEVPIGPGGRTDPEEVRRRARGTDVVALAFQSPAFHGVVEDARALAAVARAAAVPCVQVFDPYAVAIFTSPGEAGVDVACAEGMALAGPPSFGGPSLGMLACRSEHMRHMPGRIVGRTRDVRDRVAYTNTLQAREQHIRRERATSNICTNAQLMALRATLCLSALGRHGLVEVAELCRARAHHAAARITSLPGFTLRWPAAPFFKEIAVRCPRPAAEINRVLAARGIVGGLDLGRFDPALGDVLLLCFTELNPPGDIDLLVAALSEVLL